MRRCGDTHHLCGRQIGGWQDNLPGKDSWRLAQAGSDSVVIASSQSLALIRRLDGEMALGEIAAFLTDIDIILTEGYKRGDAPKIEVSRRERGGGLLCAPDELVAIVSDQPFDLDDAGGIVDLLERCNALPKCVAPNGALTTT